MAEFFAELRRRRIYRVAAAYLVVAWLAIQVVNNLAPALRLPEWASSFVVVLLLIGLPITLLIAWVQQMPKEGSAPARNALLDWTLVGALVVVLLFMSYQQLAPSSDAPPPSAQTASGTVSLAVLPFSNLSGDASQEFFSDGMTQEITAALAKIANFQVVGRTSAFEFKNQNRDLRVIGQALGATHLIEGSVRRAGDRVRITAQLIRADNGRNLWAENYDRQLTDIFAVQEDIARAIAGALRIPLGLETVSLVPNQTNDLDSYQQYLRARTLIRTRDQGPMSEAAVLLEQVTARDPNYAPAWAILALAYVLTPSDSLSDSGDVEALRRGVAVALPKGEAAARRAIELDPKLAAGYMALGRIEVARAHWSAAEKLYMKSLELDPYDTDGLTLYSNVLAGVGRLKEALAVKERVLTLEPFVPAFSITAADVMWLNGQNDSAVAILTGLPPGLGAPNLARIYASMGRYSEAAERLKSVSASAYLPGTVEQATSLIRSAPAPVSSAQSVRRLGTLSFVFLHIGAPERSLEPNEARAAGGYSVAMQVAHLWHPSYAPLRKTERFKAYIRKVGLVDYWRERGWPELCKPVGADDFECS